MNERIDSFTLIICFFCGVMFSGISLFFLPMMLLLDFIDAVKGVRKA